MVKQNPTLPHRILFKYCFWILNMALDFTIPIGGADLRFISLQTGSTMGGLGELSSVFAYPAYLLASDLSRYP